VASFTILIDFLVLRMFGAILPALLLFSQTLLGGDAAASQELSRSSLIRRENDERAAGVAGASQLAQEAVSSVEAEPPFMHGQWGRNAAPHLSVNGSRLPLDVKGHVIPGDSKLWNIVNVVKDDDQFAGVIEPTPPPTGLVAAAERAPASLPSTTEGVVGDSWTAFQWGWDENQSFKVQHDQDSSGDGEYYVTSTPAADRQGGPSTTVATASFDSVWVSSTTASADDQLGIHFPRLR
jgi:hypothetical protein